MTKNQTTVELKADREVVIARTFNAPARIVFEAYTKPEFVKRWWAPQSRGVSVVSVEADVRVGGAYRYVIRHQEHGELGFSGKYTAVEPHTRLVYTQFFEPMMDAGAVICTVVFEEHDGKTQLRAHELYPSAEARSGALTSGMEAGLRETFDQLDELVATLG